MDKYCPSCSIVLPSTAQRCTTCGNTATLAPGAIVNSGAETYTIDSVLGIGGMGIVYKAYDTSALTVVLKQLYVDDPAELLEATRRFKREAHIQSVLNHPAFPQGFGYFTDQGLEFMAMEFVPGDDLEKVLALRPSRTMDEDEVLQMGIQICDGLLVLHNFHDPVTSTLDPIIHRDIKPANIILRPSGQICILDLGIARALKQSAATQARATRAGTFEYASPQQVSGTDMSVRDDIYSLAVTLFHLKIGAPFVGDFTQRGAEIDQLPAAWRAAFRRAINNDTNLRQRSAQEFKTELTALLPPHLQPAVPGGAGAPAPAPAIPAAGRVGIRWRVQAAYMANPNEWCGPIAGQAVAGTVGMPGVNIIPIMTDVGPGAMAHNTRGTVVNSGAHGDFGLSMLDVTVPVTVDRREIEIVVEDQNTGQELYRETVELNRPGVGQRVRARGAAGVGAVAHGAAVPFRVVGHGIAGVARAARRGAGVGVRGMARGIAWPFRQMARGGRGARNWVANASLTYLYILSAVVFSIAGLVGLAMDNAWIWTLSFWLAFVSGRAANLSGRGLLPDSWKWAVYPRLSTVVIGSWLIFLITHIFAR